MSDRRTRELERRVASGDRSAIVMLDAALRRSGYPLWMRDLDALENSLLLTQSTYNTAALECIPFMREAYLAAENRAWCDVVLNIEMAAFIFQQCNRNFSWYATMRPDVEHEQLVFFDWGRRQTELWEMSGKPGRDPKKQPFIGDIVGRRLVAGGDRRGRWRSFSWGSSTVPFAVTDEKLSPVTEAASRVATILNWRRWATARSVNRRTISEIFSWTLDGDAAEKMIERRLNNNTAAIDLSPDWWIQT